MTDTNPSHQPDNLFGICHRIGEDFGFNPLWLRIALGGAFILAPVAVIAGYFAMGGFVLLGRVAFPVRKRSSAEVVTLPAPVAEVTPALAKAA